MPSMLQMLQSERGPAIRRVLRGLPDEFLAALVEGIDDADMIVSGRLFAGRNGGCAVGVMLRVMRPDLPRRPGWRRSRRSLSELDRELAKQVAHLGALESVFDRSVELAGWRYPDAHGAEIARTVAS